MASGSLRSTLHALAMSFADSVIQAIRTAPIDELMEGGHVPSPGPRRAGRPPGRAPRPAPARRAPAAIVNGRLARRSSDDLERTLGLVLAAVQSNGMRAEELQKFLSLDKRELPRVLALGLSKKVLKKSGKKRATVYSAA